MFRLKAIAAMRAAGLAALIVMAAELHAAAPMLISYQGKLTNAGGNPISGTFPMTFAIYPGPSGGTAVWSEAHGAVVVNNGAFTVNLGSVTPFIDWYFWDTTRYLGITVGADPEQTPRTRLLSVPYALKAGSIDGAKSGTLYGATSLYGNLIVTDQTFGTALNVNSSAGGHYNNWGVEATGMNGQLFNIGVRGTANDAWGSTAYNSAGIYGQGISNFGGVIWAGYFDGWVNVTGTFSAGAKFFKIDDPQQPADRTLEHACVESDQYKNIYDGSVILDHEGRAAVTLPDWFDDLNGEYRYQLTCVGGYAPVYVAERLSQNRFVIAGGIQGLEVSWQVTGVRKDPYALAHPIEVIREKKPELKGKYLHPIELGKCAEEGVDYAARKFSEEQEAQR